MSTHAYTKNQAALDVQDINQTLAKKGFSLKKGDARRVAELLKTGAAASVQEAAEAIGLEQGRRVGKGSKQPAFFSVQDGAVTPAEPIQPELMSLLSTEVFAALDSPKAQERFLQLVVEEALEGSSARVLSPAETGSAEWRVESEPRQHVLTSQTIEEFLSKPAPGYSYEGEDLDEHEVIVLAGELIEELFAETVFYVIDKTKEDGPDWAKSLIPSALDKERYEQFFEQIFDVVTDESEANSRVVARLAEIAKLPFKETLLKYRPEAAGRIHKDIESQTLKATAMRNAREKLDAEAERIRKVFLGSTGERLPKRRAVELINAIVEKVDNLEGLFLAVELMKHDRVISCLERTGQALLAECTTDCDMAFSHFPVFLQGPLAQLFFRLNKERASSKKHFSITALDGSDTVFRFDESNWAYFMAWALTAALGSPADRFSVVIRREETLMAAGGTKPMMSVAGLLIEGLNVHRLSAQEMQQRHTTDAQTGEPLEPEPGVRYIGFSSLCPGLFEPVAEQAPPSA